MNLAPQADPFCAEVHHSPKIQPQITVIPQHLFPVAWISDMNLLDLINLVHNHQIFMATERQVKTPQGQRPPMQLGRLHYFISSCISGRNFSDLR